MRDQFVTVKIPGFRAYVKNVASLTCFEMPIGISPRVYRFSPLIKTTSAKNNLVRSLNVTQRAEFKKKMYRLVG